MKLLLHAFCKKNSYPIWFLTYGFLTIIFLISGCTKDETTTTIKGKIIDDASKLALEQVSTWIIADDYESQKSYSDTCFTDFKGEYNLSVTGNSINAASMYVYKPGYVFMRFNIIPGSNLNKDITLLPYDSYVTFKISNKSNVYSYIYGRYWAKVGYHQFMSSIKDPINVPMGTVYKESRVVPGDNYIYFTWDYFFYPSDKKFPNLDSIWVPRGDTVTYNITM